MELDELKDRSKNLRTPRVNVAVSPELSPGVNGLIDALKAAERKQYLSFRNSLPLWIVAAALFLFTLIIKLVVLDEAKLFPTLVFRVMLVVLYVTLAIVIIVRMRRLLKIDYAEPVALFLEKAEKRFVFPGPLNIVGISLLALPISYVTHFYISDVLGRYFNMNNLPLVFVGTLGFFSAIFAFGWWATRANWKKEKAPLLEEIKRMRRDLQEEQRDSAD